DYAIETGKQDRYSRWQARPEIVPHSGAKTLIRLSNSKQEFFFHPFDPIGDLSKSDLDYLLVLSSPPKTVAAGKEFTYEPKVMTKGDEYSLELMDGPDGAEVKGNKVVWKVPASAADTEVEFLLRVINPAEDEVFHSFKIKVKD
ncbi:MAG: hypothetical protein ACYTAF_12450, partial [Planctomycetota bacterium]